MGGRTRIGFIRKLIVVTIVLSSLSAHGPDRTVAEVTFDKKRRLIRGPSETGKSYIFDALWYLLGGTEPPERLPLADGYQEFRLRFTAGDKEFEVRKALIGGPAGVYVRALGNEEELAFEYQEGDIGELLVELSGAKGKKILRNHSKRGDVTGDDVRHWALWSQTELPSKTPTVGEGPAAQKREASFHLFLAGTDDSAIELRKSSNDAERAKGALAAAESSLARVESIIPEDVTRPEVVDALERVDETLSAMTSQYEARATLLKTLRHNVSHTTEALNSVDSSWKHAQSMISRFELLQSKYANDLARLGATNEGVAFFEELATVDCPLCATPAVVHTHAHDLKSSTPYRYRKAIAAEAEKIRVLSVGLKSALGHEHSRYKAFEVRREQLFSDLRALQNQESIALQKTRVDFTGDPKTLALRRSELASILGNFDECEFLKAEIIRLKKLTVRKRISVTRESGEMGRKVADQARALLVAWGLGEIQNISLDDLACDLRVDDRRRLSFGAGVRGLYLSALVVSFMENALREGFPHLGVVVLDSPLKAYADVDSDEIQDVPPETVIDKFYRWLAEWNGLGQVIVLENEEVKPELAQTLKPVVFTRKRTVGRYGFYPLRDGVRLGPKAEAEAAADGASESSPKGTAT